MNTEHLNNVFNDMAPSKEQKQKMFAEIMKAKNVTKKSAVIPFGKYAVAAVAVIAIGATAVASYYVLNGNDNQKSGIMAGVQKNRDEHMMEASTLADRAEKPESVAMIETNDYENETEQSIISERAYEKSESIAKESDDVSEENEAANVNNKDNGHVESAKHNNEVDVERGEKTKAEASVEQYIPTLDETEKKTENSENVLAMAPEMSVDSSSDGVMSEEDGELKYDSNNKNVHSGGGGGGSVASGAVKNLSYDEIKKHSVYSKLLPSAYENDLKFGGAYESSNTLRTVYYDLKGGTINIIISPYAGAKVVDVNEIKAQTEKTAHFSLECGDYFVTYKTHLVDGESLYKLVISAPYYK